MTEWGEAISVNGKRPEWLRDDDPVMFENKPGEWLHGFDWEWAQPLQPEDHGCPVSIRLPATHPYYLVQRYNAEHGTSFVYWPGGDAAPKDWDQGDVLRRRGDVTPHLAPTGAEAWTVGFGGGPPCPGDVIGYRRKRTAAAQPDMVQVRRMTEAEVLAVMPRWVDVEGMECAMKLARHLGIIRPEPTEAERIAAKTGLDLATVTAVLDAREGE